MCFTVEVLREEEVLAHRGAKNSFRTKFGAERLTKYSMLLAAMRLGETPVPIPNTTVKPKTAESTALETVWEGRWPPTSKRKEGTGLETGGGL